jgi:hypothetical protein
LTRVIEITKLRAHLLSNVDERGNRIPDYIVASDCRISNAVLSKYASGKKAFTHKHLTALCRYFKLQPNEIGGWIRFEYAEQD